MGAEERSRLVAVVAAIAQCATILLTWPLWTARSDPPNLPVVSALSHVHWGPWLLLLSLFAVVWPRAGSISFAVVLALAALGDQTRLQPEMVSLALLMSAPLFGDGGRTIARWHISTLWLWAGLNKVLSTGWSGVGATFIASSLGHEGLRPWVAVALPLCEVTVGLSGLIRRSWPVARWGGLALGLSVFVTLSPVFGDWNSSVWPWTIALGISSTVLFAPGARADRRRLPAGVVTAVVAMAAYPGLFYAGWVDAYLAHNLYTNNTSVAQVCTSRSICSDAPFDTWDALNVPLPPEPRLYQQWFQEICTPDTTLVVLGPFTRFQDPQTRRSRCDREPSG